MKEKIWLSSPHLTGDEHKYVKEAFDDNCVAPLSPNVNGLEQDICKYSNAKFGSVLNRKYDIFLHATFHAQDR